MQTMERPVVVLEQARPPGPSEPRRACARDVFVTIVVCLCLWALLAAPLLHRSAEGGPGGTRRAAALALLRPLVAISDGLLLSGATSSVERALGRDPEGAPGGELILPAFELPPDEIESKATHVAPTGAPDPAGTSQPTTREGEAEAPTEENASAAALRPPTPSHNLRAAV